MCSSRPWRPECQENLWEGKAMRWVIYPLFVFLVLALPGEGARAAEADKLASLRGMVRDRNGKQVSGAVIKIRNPKNGITVTVFSDRGSYRASDLSPGQYAIAAGLAGHEESAKAEVMLNPGKDSVHDITLSIESARPIPPPADWIPLLPDDGDGAKEL